MKCTLLIALILLGGAIAILKEEYDSCIKICQASRYTTLDQLTDQVDTKDEFTIYNKCAFNQDPLNGDIINSQIIQPQECRDLAAITDFTDANIKIYRMSVDSCNSKCMKFQEDINQEYEYCTNKCISKLIADYTVKNPINCFNTCKDKFLKALQTLSQEDKDKIVLIYAKYETEKTCQDNVLLNNEFEDPNYFQKLFDCKKTVYIGVKPTKAEEDQIICQVKCMGDSGSDINWTQINSFYENTLTSKLVLALFMFLSSIIL